MRRRALAVALALLCLAGATGALAAQEGATRSAGSAVPRFLPLSEAAASVPALGRVIRVDLRGVTLAQALRSVTHSGELGFTYSASLPGLERRVTLTSASITVLEALTAILEGSELELLVSPTGHTVLLPQPARAPPAPAPARRPVPVVRGVLTEEATGGPVAGATIGLATENGQVEAWTLTDREGAFSLVAPTSGRYRLTAERIGIQRLQTEPFQVEARTPLERRLVATAAAIEIEGITAEARAGHEQFFALTEVDTQPVLRGCAHAPLPPQPGTGREVRGITVAFDVTSTGMATNARVSGGRAGGLGHQAVAAALSCAFTPATLNGLPVGVRGLQRRYTFEQ
jgi:hypothetical protein